MTFPFLGSSNDTPPPFHCSTPVMHVSRFDLFMYESIRSSFMKSISICYREKCPRVQIYSKYKMNLTLSIEERKITLALVCDVNKGNARVLNISMGR